MSADDRALERDESERDLYRPPRHSELQRLRNLQHVQEAREALRRTEGQ